MRLGLAAVRLPHTRTARWTTGGVAVVVVAAITTVALAGGKSASPQTAASTVSTVRRGTVAVTASAAGTVQAVTTRGLSFSVSGTVTEVDVHAGDSVTAGQVLARIDNADAQTAVNSAQDAVASAQTAVNTAEQTPSPTPASNGCAVGAAYVLPGSSDARANAVADTVTQPDLVMPTASTTPSASTSPSPSPSASAGGRPSPSGSASAPPTSGTGGGQPSHGGAPGNGGAPGACGGSAGGGTSGGGTSGGGTRGGATDSLFSAQQQLNNAQLALVQAQQKLAGTVITAPVAGKVLSVAGTVGGAESPGGGGFIVLGRVSDTAVTAQFTETDVAHLAVGQPAAITLPDRAGQKFTGKVSQVSPAGTTSGRLVRYAVLIAFDQVPADLLYGQSANVAVTTQSVGDVLYVSSSAVTGIRDGSGTVTVRADGHDDQRTVQIGLRGDQYTEVKSGLSEGDSVVVGGR